MNSLLHSYVEMFGDVTPFVTSFLSAPNLSRLQLLMTTQLQTSTQNPNIAVIEWTPAHDVAVVTFAYRYRATDSTELERGNWVFADQMHEQNEAHYYETSFWRRWRTQGVPNPTTLPIPIASERTDFTTDISNYMMHEAVGSQVPRC